MDNRYTVIHSKDNKRKKTRVKKPGQRKTWNSLVYCKCMLKSNNGVKTKSKFRRYNLIKKRLQSNQLQRTQEVSKISEI